MLSGGLELVLVYVAVGAVAFAYSSVGHAGASGYIAVLTLASLSASVIRPTALVLNILVASLASWNFARAGFFAWGRFWPLAITSVPAAFAGGYMDVPADVFKILVGIALLLAALRFLASPRDPERTRFPSLPVALATGAGIGLLAGLTGTGGGVFLTPVMLFLAWATTKETAAVSSLFILVNSISGLAGFLTSGNSLPGIAAGLAVVVVVFGFAGSYLGSRRFPVRTIRLVLVAVLLLASAKLIVGF